MKSGINGRVRGCKGVSVPVRTVLRSGQVEVCIARSGESVGMKPDRNELREQAARHTQ